MKTTGSVQTKYLKIYRPHLSGGDKGGREMSVGMPETLYLEIFGKMLHDVFGEIPYHVGSSLSKKKFRDVDVRIILGTKKYKWMGFGNDKYSHLNRKWVAMTMAFSELGKRITGLPIDFQIQSISVANKFNGKRSALGLSQMKWRI